MHTAVNFLHGLPRHLRNETRFIIPHHHPIAEMTSAFLAPVPMVQPDQLGWLLAIRLLERINGDDNLVAYHGVALLD